MKTLDLFSFLFLSIALTLLLVKCTPAQRQMAVPIAKASGLVCLVVPEDGRELCCAASEAAKAVTEALAKQDKPPVEPKPD